MCMRECAIIAGVALDLADLDHCVVKKVNWVVVEIKSGGRDALAAS